MFGICFVYLAYLVLYLPTVLLTVPTYGTAYVRLGAKAYAVYVANGAANVVQRSAAPLVLCYGYHGAVQGYIGLNMTSQCTGCPRRDP